jgi:hypothetical protein
MPRKKRIRSTPSIQSLYEDLERTYQEWKKHHPLWALGRNLALEGSTAIRSDPEGLEMHRKASRAFDEFDTVICKLVNRSKTALADSRVLERIRQAESFADRKFFRDLADAVKTNVGIDRRVNEGPAVAEIYRCALEYVEGNEGDVEQTYNYWKNFDIEKRRKEQPNASSMIDRWEKIREAITGESESGEGGDLKSFRDRVRTMAAQIRKSSMPIPQKVKP